MSDSNLWTPARVAAELGVTRFCVYTMIAQGRLPAKRSKRTWMIDPAAVLAVERIPPGPRPKYVCKYGHPLTLDNVRTTPIGTRSCIACDRRRCRERYHRRMARLRGAA